MSALVSVKKLVRVFDVSKPWLNRLIERRKKALLTAVADVSFDIPERTVYGLVGESGSGKSTIGKIIVGLACRRLLDRLRSKELTCFVRRTSARSTVSVPTSR